MKSRTRTSDSDGERLDEFRARLWKSSKGDICYRLCIWGNVFNLRILPKLDAEFGILRDEFNILLCLAGAGRLTGTDISRLVGRPRNSISRCADRLLRRKLIRARSTSVDKRQTIYEILPAGRDLYDRMLPHLEELEEDMLGALSAEDREALDVILNKLFSRRARLDGLE